MKLSVCKLEAMIVKHRMALSPVGASSRCHVTFADDPHSASTDGEEVRADGAVL